MPIRPENAKRYPPNWDGEVVPRIRRRSGNVCECTGHCGNAHGPTGKERCTASNGMLHPITRSVVVLTVMHLDHQPENCDDANLLHGCQRCHNSYDQAHRRAGIRERAQQVQAEAHAGDLFGKARE
jgi:hypothetical protein